MIKNFYDKEEGFINANHTIKDSNIGIENNNNNISETKIKVKMFSDDKSEDNKIVMKPVGQSLYEIIYKLKHNTDLNELINKINANLTNRTKIPPININSITFNDKAHNKIKIKKIE